MKPTLKRKYASSIGTYYETADGWRIWREPYPPRHWYVNIVDCDETDTPDGFKTKREAVAWLANQGTQP